MSIQHLFKCSTHGGTYLEANTCNRPSLFAACIYNMANYNKVTNKWKGVGGVKCSDKCLTIIRIIAIPFEYPEVNVNMVDGNIKPLTSIL